MVSHAYRVAVFIDWQNAYQSARRAFGLQGQATEQGTFSPYQLAQIFADGNDRRSDGSLVRVEVHRGLPSSVRDPIGYGVASSVAERSCSLQSARRWATSTPSPAPSCWRRSTLTGRGEAMGSFAVGRTNAPPSGTTEGTPDARR
jgi:hypothetical protein